MACEGDHFTIRNKLPSSNFLDPLWCTGRRRNVAFFCDKLRADPSFELIAGNAHLSLVRSVGMEKRVLYPRQTNTCLPIFCFLRAERATRQRCALLQQVIHRSKLPAHRWKRSFELSTFSGDEKASILPMADKCLFANLLLFASREGDEATSPSFTTSYASIQASSPSLEMLI